MALDRRRVLQAIGGMALLAPTGLAARGRGFVGRAEELGRLHSVIVRRNDREVFARAFGGPGLDAAANVKSVSKTILSLLVGIAIDRGVWESTEQRVVPLLGMTAFGDARDRITVGDLLTNRAGLDSTSGGAYGDWVASDDWVSYALEEDMEDFPGGEYIYSSGGWHVLGVALSRSAGRPLLDLARDWLFDPLGVDLTPWQTDPDGNYFGGNNMLVSPRGLATIGQCVLEGGRGPDNAPVVPRSWIERSWEQWTTTSSGTHRYGYGWFITWMDGTRVCYARGFGGQVMAVVPERETVIVMTSDPTRPASLSRYFGELTDLVERIIVS